MAAKVVEIKTVGMDCVSRCDRCGAQAYVKVTMPQGTTVLLCAHHAESHWDALTGIEGAIIHDHRPFLKAQEVGQPTKVDRR